ncbi:hypothetical protein GE061_009422 [Apolygus lucorum]|uniref:Claspin n=1 Tax=Apolygus lucorum TaxID=248454 RepID=A0A8S9Y1N3_APOLU|nr:hypothetical protein GE061_009422 [Apolygus lucorum]
MTECEDAFDRLIASTKTTEVSSVGKNTLDSDSEDEVAQRIHSKKAVLNDSSDEDDPPVTFKKGILDFNCNGKEEEVSEVNTPSDDEEIGHRKKPAKRIKKLLDDSDDEPEVSQSHKPVDLDVDRPSPPRSGENSDSESSVRSTRSSKSSKSGRSSSDSSSGEESEGEVSIEAIKSKIINKHIPPKSSKLLEGVGQDPEKKGNSKPKKEKAPSRKAKEAALAEIHSETQRMIRERQVSLPYHKPKQRSLADFLNRRKLAPTVRLKTSSDELAKVWKHAEEREKTAELFYRSDSDEETEKIDNKENESSKADEPAIPRSDPVEFSRNNDTTTADRLQDLLDQPTASVSQPLDSEEFPRLLLSEVLVDSENTEEGNSLKCVDPVVENDVASNKESCDAVDSAEKSDAVTMDVADDATIAPVKDTELVENSENMTDSVVLEDSVPLSGLSQNSLCEKISSLNLPIPKCPRISGAPDEVIDLDELSTKPGAFGLMQRFIKHSKLKSKVIQQQNVLSVMTSEVNDCGEIINLSEETIKVNKKVEPKPGERLVVLQTTLKQKMAMNRGQQLAKKLEEYKLYEEEFYGVVGNDEGEEDMFSEDECGKKEEKEEKEIEADVDNPFLEDEAAESDNEDAAESDNDGAAEDEEDGANEDDAEGSDVEETASVLLGDASDEEGDSNTCPVSENEDVEDDVLPTPPIPTALHSLAGTQNTDSINESQLMALCSGNFSSSTIDLKVLETSSEAFQNAEDEGSKVPNPQDSPKYAIDSDDEEILVSKKQKNKKRKLSFSDDEENDGAENDGAALGESDDDEPIKLSLNDDDTAERNEEVESDEENVAEDENFIEDEDDEEALR